MPRHSRSRSLVVFCLVAGGVLVADAAGAVTWQTAVNHPGDDQYVSLDYPLVFVTAPIVEIPQSGGTLLGSYDIGTDVLSATRPSSGNELWALYPDGQVKKLFPLDCHETIDVTRPDTGLPVDLIDTPSGELTKGSVVEPNVSEDGTKVYFAYFHDTTDNIASGQGSLSKRGADLYTLDLQPLLNLLSCTSPCAIQFNPNACGPVIGTGSNKLNLPVKRLTFREYVSGSSQQDPVDRIKNAMNQGMADNPEQVAQPGSAGTVYMHATEMRTATGLKLVYTSNERRLENSNGGQDKPNYNLNLHIADLQSDGSLGASRQFQYYTTTSAMSPTPLRNGVAYAYQSTTADARDWDIQSSDSAGVWSTLLGYGTNPDLFHLGSFCVDTQGDEVGASPAGDYYVGVHYYNLNNEGYGSLWKINLADVGTNDYTQRNGFGVKPVQTGSRQISLGVQGGDYASAKLNGEYIGKITTPRCGKLDELLMTYTPTSANGKEFDPEGNKNIYHGHIAYRLGLDDFHPSVDYSPATNDGLRTVIDDSDNDVNLVWPTPILSWEERTGDEEQQHTASVIDPRSAVTPGEPMAQIGTSALYNTDRKPFDCFLSGNPAGQPYNPHTYSGNQGEQVIRNYDGMTYVPDPSDFCKEIDQTIGEELVLGVAINITSNETNLNYNNRGYGNDGDGYKEVAKLLGVYDVRSQGDQSFEALIPSHTPIEFHLIDKRYGMRLLDVRSWHSAYPQQTLTSCGGCHEHNELEAPIPFAGTVADLQPPLDMMTGTPQVAYDATCNPVLTTTANPTEAYPEWKADIYAGFDTNCGSCHNSTISSNGAALAVLTYSDESTAFNTLKSTRYADSISGALGSQAFWAARGQRTDGRNNSVYSGTGYFFASGHVPPNMPSLCTNTTDANWVRSFGQWIDNHMPRDTGNGCTSTEPGGKCGAHFDRFHPAVDVALARNTCALDKLRVGYWDDTGTLSSVTTYLNGVSIDTYSGPNGFHGIPGLSLALGDRVKVIAIDEAENRQIYEKTVRQMYADCKVRYPRTAIPVQDPLPAP